MELVRIPWWRKDQARHRAGPPPTPDADRGGYIAGLATNLGNPKSGVFAISLLPQFIDPQGNPFVGGVLLGAIRAATTTCWYLLFVWDVDKGRSLIARPAVTTLLHGITGAVLLLLGVTVVVGA